MKFQWVNITGTFWGSPSTLEIFEEPTRKSKKKWIEIENFGDSYSVNMDKCPTGWFFVKDFYGHSGWVRKTHRMRIMDDKAQIIPCNSNF